MRRRKRKKVKEKKITNREGDGEEKWEIRDGGV